MSKRAAVDKSEMPAQRLKKVAWWLALVAGIFPIVWRQVTVSDAWWHVALGKWLVERRSMPDLSKFYFTPFDAGRLAGELRWEWLGDIVLYLAYAVGGAQGIQWLVVGCALAGLVFLARCAKGRSPWILVLLVAVCLGTYQLQLARNSVYSLVLYPALLWLGIRNSGPPSWREYAGVCGLLFLWSCLHGSCALGWVTACALLGPRALSAFVSSENWRGGLRSSGLFALAMGLALVLISAGRPDAMHFLGAPFRHVSTTAVQSLQENKQAEKKAPVAITPQNVPAPTISLKEWLNSSIWRRDPSVPWSNDYWSPFDMLPGMKPIEAAYGLALLALAGVLASRNVPAGLLLAWVGAVFLGLGYVRMFGYTALASGAVALVAGSRFVGKSPKRVQIGGWVIFGAWLVFSWGLFFSGRMDQFIPDGQHVSKTGKVPIYDEATAVWVKVTFPEEKVFTTIESGSYCVLRWNFEKPVFLDGFFAPHTREVWAAYNEALASGAPDALHDLHGAAVAIIPTTSPQWIDIFRNAQDWSPVAVGAGSVVFVHQSVALKMERPLIFCTAAELRGTGFYFREATLKALFLILASDSGKRFGADDWSLNPNLEELRGMAPEVFPQL